MGDLRRRRDRRCGPHGGADQVSPVGLSVARMVHHRGPQEDRHHVHGAGADHVAAGLCRRGDDAAAVDAGLQRVRGLSELAPLRPDLHGAWRDHDLLRGDALHHRPDELSGAAADRRARRVLPVPEQPVVLDDGGRCGDHHGLPVRGRVRADRLAGLSAAVGHRLQPLGRGRLLHLGPAGGGRGDDAVGHQSAGDHHQDARAWHGLHAHADLHLDGALHEHPDRGVLPGADGHAGPADAGPLCRHELLHQRSWRQRHDVREPDLDLGPPRGLHPDPSAVRRLLRGHGDLLGQAAVRLYLDGLCDRLHHGPQLSGLAAPLLHDGVGRVGERVLRHHHDDHLGSHRGQAVQLDLHHVSRPHPVRPA